MDRVPPPVRADPLVETVCNYEAAALPGSDRYAGFSVRASVRSLIIAAVTSSWTYAEHVAAADRWQTPPVFGVCTRSRGGSRGGVKGRLHLVLRSDASVAKRLRSAVRVWLAGAGITGAAASAVTSAVNEAFVNAVEHPCERATDLVVVEGAVTSSEVVVRVRDDGAWSEELDPDRQHFGLGLIAALMDSVEINRGATGSMVTLRRSL